MWKKIYYFIMVWIFICSTATADVWTIKSLWEQEACYCPATVINNVLVEPYPSKPLKKCNYDCDDGDMTLFNGLLCASGDERGCDGVRRAQSPDGRFWRSPIRALNNNGGMGDSDDSKSFSPDMSLGVLLYVAKTGDTCALSRWLNWIENNRPCLLRYGDTLPPCSVFFPWVCGISEEEKNKCVMRGLPQICDSWECTVRPLDADIIGETAHAFGLDAQEGIEEYNSIILKVLLGYRYKYLEFFNLLKLLVPLNGLDLVAEEEAAIILGSYLAKDTTEKILLNIAIDKAGFPQHLNGVRILLMRMLDRGDPVILNGASAILAEKEPQNPFFAYLNEGATVKVMDLSLDLCPATIEDIQNSHKSQWAWERTDSEEAWKDTMLWDCIFMANFFINEPNIFEMQPWAAQQGYFCDTQKWVAGDFNGDGKTDLANIFGYWDDDHNETGIDVHLTTGTSFTYNWWSREQGWFWDSQKWVAGDFNGDGKTDLANIFGYWDDDH
ncbi:MAG: FG-GAP repeat domain-containing protein, partial [bacterium]